MTKISKYMSKDPKAVQKTTSVFDAVAVMNENDIDCLIVTDEYRPAGIFTTTDLRTRVVGAGLDTKKTAVESVMTDDFKTLNESEEMMKARRLMSREGVKHIPVVNDGGLLVGMLSVTDLIGGK